MCDDRNTVTVTLSLTDNTSAEYVLAQVVHNLRRLKFGLKRMRRTRCAL